VSKGFCRCDDSFLEDFYAWLHNKDVAGPQEHNNNTEKEERYDEK